MTINAAVKSSPATSTQPTFYLLHAQSNRTQREEATNLLAFLCFRVSRNHRLKSDWRTGTLIQKACFPFVDERNFNIQTGRRALKHRNRRTSMRGVAKSTPIEISRRPGKISDSVRSTENQTVVSTTATSLPKKTCLKMFE
jgi:hypothetical protein